MALQTIIDIIYKRTGIDARSMGQYAFQNAANKCMENARIESFDLYIEYLQSSETALSALIEEIIVPETWFFREKNAYIALTGYVKRQKNFSHDNPVNILSLPSSTGEEPYSIAMTLINAGCHPEHFNIDAMDISQNNIDSAICAIYRKNSFRENDENAYRERFFTSCQLYYPLSS